MIGPGPSEPKSVGFLGRQITWKPWGLTYQADPKRVLILGKEWNLMDSRGVGTPGTNEEKGEEEGELMDPERARVYRRAAARLNYLSLDRPDIAFASKEASRHMANPREGNEVILKRAILYFVQHPVC